MGATHFSGLSVSPANLTASSASVTEKDHAGKVVTLNRAAGQALTLPNATGSGNKFQFFVATTITSNSTTIKVARAADTMSGVAIVANDTDASASIFETAADSDTVTLNGSTTGGILGCMVTLQDVEANKWYVRVEGAATGTEATPFSATVS